MANWTARYRERVGTYSNLEERGFQTGLSGLELQRRLVADNRPVPIVFVTAHYLEEEERISAMEAGAVAFLSKPFTEQELLNAISASATISKKLANGSAEERD